MSDYVNSMSGSYIDPDNSYSTLEKYNLISDLKFVNQKHVPSSNFPTLPQISTEPDVNVLTYDTTEPYPIVDKAYGSSCVPQSYYIGKCPTNQFVKTLSSHSAKPTPTPTSLKKPKNIPLLIEVVIEEGLSGKTMYRVVTESLPSSVKDMFKAAVSSGLTNPIYVQKNTKSKSGSEYVFFEQKGKKLKKLKVKLPLLHFIRKKSKSIGNTGFEEGGIMKYTHGNEKIHDSNEDGHDDIQTMESMQTPPMQTPPMKSPAMKFPTQTPPMKSPMQTSPMKSPMQTPPMKSSAMKFPTQTPQMKSPMQTPPMKSPMQTPMMKSQTN